MPASGITFFYAALEQENFSLEAELKISLANN
jgi:hypothetical protein